MKPLPPRRMPAVAAKARSAHRFRPRTGAGALAAALLCALGGGTRSLAQPVIAPLDADPPAAGPSTNETPPGEPAPGEVPSGDPPPDEPAPDDTLPSAAEEPQHTTTIRAGAQAPADMARREAVDVVDVKAAREQTADMGEVLNRVQGVLLRRSGGLGTPATFSIQGLSDKRVRFLVDGIPADLSGLGLGPANIPVTLIDRVEVYKGVVPIRFGADALGGAVNFVTRDLGLADRLEISAELASFGTFRGSAVSRVALVPQLGIFAEVDAFFDRTDNDYKIQAQLPDERGRPHTETVTRFHDGYEAYGLSPRVGVMGLPWADRLVLGAFFTETNKEIQNDLRGNTPYGDITQGDITHGLNLQYLKRDRPGSRLGATLLLSHAGREGHFDDISHNLWNWRGDITRARPIAGERSKGAQIGSDSTLSTARFNLAWRHDLHHRFEASTTATLSDETRTSHSTLASVKTDVASDFQQLKWVTGLSYQLQLWEARFDNEVFVKMYRTHAEAPFTPTGGVSEQVSADRVDYGLGDTLRFELIEGLHLKGSYEFAIRMPDPLELFGDGAFVSSSLDLENETSHNLNAGLVLEPLDTPAGRISANANVFWRNTTDLIYLVVVLENARYQNISDVETLGFEGGLSWSGPRHIPLINRMSLGANGTTLNAVNRSDDGFFGRFEGDRIPNLPYLFANANAAVDLTWPEAPVRRLQAYWYARYVHEYFLFWESEGDKDTKLKIPEQVTHDVGLTATSSSGRITATFSVNNLLDARRFDNIGVQLAGRSLHLKVGVGLD